MELVKVNEIRLLKGVREDDIADVWMKYIVGGSLCDEHMMQAGIYVINFEDGSSCITLSLGEKYIINVTRR